MSNSSDGGDIKRVDAFSDEDSDASDSEDCEIINDNSKVKSNGFFEKLKLRTMLKSKGHKKTDVFREGESDEYNSEVDGDEIDLEQPMVNYDILGVRDGTNEIHSVLIKLVEEHEEVPEDLEDRLTYKRRR